MLVDDRSSVVSLPELPLLGVLPGTGGLTRVTDKRHVRRDIADYFATRAEGVGGRRAVQWGLIDEVVPRSGWADAVAARAGELAGRSGRAAGGARERGIELTPLAKVRDGDMIRYTLVTARLDRPAPRSRSRWQAPARPRRATWPACASWAPTAGRWP